MSNGLCPYCGMPDWKLTGRPCCLRRGAEKGETEVCELCGQVMVKAAANTIEDHILCAFCTDRYFATAESIRAMAGRHWSRHIDLVRARQRAWLETQLVLAEAQRRGEALGGKRGIASGVVRKEGQRYDPL